MILINLLYGLLIAMRVYYYILIAGIIVSWIPNSNRYLIFRIIRKTSDAYIGPFHGLLVFGFLDFTPIIGFLIYNFIYSSLGGLINLLQ